jgi:LuxR family maltose regulon positive regulatory protein
MPQGAAHSLATSETYHRRESVGWAHYILSKVAYECNQLEIATFHAQAVEKLRYVSRPMAYLQSAFIYTSIYQAQGQPDLAQQKLQMAFAFLRETNNEGLMPLAQAFQAELAVMQGNLDEARHWATTIGPFLPLTLMPYFYASKLTLPKILIAQDTPTSREQASEVLAELYTFVTDTHNIRATIQVLTLQAMLHDAQGNEPAALAHLQEALSLAEPGGFIRLFADLGLPLVSLLKRLPQVSVNPDYGDQLWQAFGEPPLSAPLTSPSPSSMREMEQIERLTTREHETLRLLGQRFTDKEIAQALSISHLTVKRHTATIYKKLKVSGRREAVAKAIHLDLL